ncbi:uncharacterized protein EURHEDRAFT_344532 [Aspergillus ruber CBS 135680]|uniref:Uncharacterized protein n=1 Tax=Aspergillus ruber (strain CBS 135680) TaxID=1388766 RepID=A0A017SJZ5_ASPRC|nr:uncharacterized protein EURHEDRAFT_344532 [Aspergillus ruber CBS 135680]EYE96969.1 hypothetical protein EURHEDRAFT_344532 [Aspergillus ruber CBS 135680]
MSVSICGYFSVCCREPLNSRLYPIIPRRFHHSNHNRIAVANMRRAHEYSTVNIAEYIRAFLVDPTVVHKSTINPSGLDRTNPVNQPVYHYIIRQRRSGSGSGSGSLSHHCHSAEHRTTQAGCGLITIVIVICFCSALRNVMGYVQSASFQSAFFFFLERRNN